jgi:hypothetical protein
MNPGALWYGDLLEGYEEMLASLDPPRAGMFRPCAMPGLLLK